uniref:nuclear pore-associated protein 1-like isoform X1 n=1 Tax=Callithrix jacchus TaxID=9483 RepID=UPI0023DD0500|nr:nuclear pore-associated protein 1-like isoform X1 [Callithrix jacchus]
MGNLLSIFRPRSRRRPLPGRVPRTPIAREASQPGPAPPVAPTLTPGPYRFLFNGQQSRKPSPGSFFGAPSRPPDMGAPVAVPPAVDCRLLLRRRTVLSARNSLVLRHPSSVRIPPPSSTFTLRPQEEAVGARKPMPIPARLPNQTKVRIQGKPRGAIEEEEQMQNWVFFAWAFALPTPSRCTAQKVGKGTKATKAKEAEPPQPAKKHCLPAEFHSCYPG